MSLVHSRVDLFTRSISCTEANQALLRLLCQGTRVLVFILALAEGCSGKAAVQPRQWFVCHRLPDATIYKLAEGPREGLEPAEQLWNLVLYGIRISRRAHH